MTSKRIKQEQIKVTLPTELHAQLVTKSIDVLGEVNLSQYLRMLIRRDLKQWLISLKKNYKKFLGLLDMVLIPHSWEMMTNLKGERVSKQK